MLAVSMLAILGATGYVVTRQEPSTVEPTSGPKVGAAAPIWTLPAIDGATLSLSDTLGNPVVLAFGASWCHPCRKEYPMLEAARRANDQLRIVGVMHDDVAGIMRGFMRSVGASWPVGDDRDGTVAGQYAIHGLPETFFLHRDGSIAAHVTGERRGALVGATQRDLRHGVALHACADGMPFVVVVVEQARG